MRPLDRLRSIKTKLGVLVAVTVAVAAVLPLAGSRLGLNPVVTVPVTVAVALLLTQLLARGMTSPLREMTAAARTMATGDYSRRVTASSRDEVGELARAFNTMAADLQAVDRQRRELVANVSHELRTPVTALRALLENLADGVVDPDPAQLRTALAQTERLSHLVSDLLDLSRVDSGLSALDARPMEVLPFLEDAVREAALAGRPVRFEVAVEPPDLLVRADRARLHQLVANLLDNAARHSPERGTVHVRAHTDDRGTVLEVADDGPGIAPAERAAVFERFTTGSGVAPHDGGTGLGLAIARWVTDLHGGSIEVADTATGCRIRACLPRHLQEGTPA
ncbi:HAMP domain-containing sensor histidine kinase [Mumia quercus]|uniref:HAMP domain-containing sensor histidine kinase n=1 Tax=Mumia quercus TaxID=2976125 RepID=UPI0021D0FE74|nr:HAMP domain-containing sensor histidine kinase [Mumia quercus]